MKKGFLLKFILTLVLILILYEIWPLPFLLLSKKVILPSANKISIFAKALVSPFGLLADISKLENQNKKLTQDNENLQSQNAINAEKTHICEALKNEIGTSKIGGFSLFPARILGRTPSTSNQILIIDKGSDDGFKNGAAVLSNGYLIGRISKTSSSQSEVELITSHDSLIPAVLEKSRQTGLVQGGLEGLELTEVPVSSQFIESESVLTSGLGGDLPAGIIVGKLEGASTKSSGLFQTLQITYPVKINLLEVVSVVKQ